MKVKYNHAVGVDLDTMKVLRRIKAELNREGARHSFADIIRMLLIKHGAELKNA